MRLSRTRTAMAVGAVCLIASLIWWLGADAPDEGAQSPVASSAASMARQVQPAAREVPSTAMTRDDAAVPQPPRDAPLAQLWSSLQGPAKAGDANAACRLAIETIRCATVARIAEPVPGAPGGQRSELQALLEFKRAPHAFGASGSADDPQVEAASDSLAKGIQSASMRCEGLSDERTATATALLRVAALAGQPDAQVVYAAGEGWFLPVPGALGSAEFEQWRREAPLVVARMLDAGHPDAPGLLAGAYSGQTWLSGLYEEDPRRAAAFLILSSRLMGKPHLSDQQLRDVASDVKAHARRDAEALYAKHYAGRAAAPAQFWLAAGTRILYSNVGFDDNAATPCAAP